MDPLRSEMEKRRHTAPPEGVAQRTLPSATREGEGNPAPARSVVREKKSRVDLQGLDRGRPRVRQIRVRPGTLPIHRHGGLLQDASGDVLP